jgi:hypothetical protein
MAFKTLSLLCNHHHHLSTESQNFLSSPTEVFPASNDFIVSFFSGPGNHHYTSSLWIMTVESYGYYLSVCDCFTVLNMIPSRFIYCSVRISFLLKAEWHAIEWMYYSLNKVHIHLETLELLPPFDCWQLCCKYLWVCKYLWSLCFQFFCFLCILSSKTSTCVHFICEEKKKTLQK